MFKGFEQHIKTSLHSSNQKTVKTTHVHLLRSLYILSFVVPPPPACYHCLFIYFLYVYWCFCNKNKRPKNGWGLLSILSQATPQKTPVSAMVSHFPLPQTPFQSYLRLIFFSKRAIWIAFTIMFDHLFQEQICNCH